MIIGSKQHLNKINHDSNKEKTNDIATALRELTADYGVTNVQSTLKKYPIVLIRIVERLL